jgi:hypothetical protein
MNDFPRALQRAYPLSIIRAARVSSHSGEGVVSSLSNCERMRAEAHDNG